MEEKNAFVAFLQILMGRSKKRAVMTLLSGPSGIGKSALIKEFEMLILEENGALLSGKYDQFKSTIPYFALIEAFSKLLGEIVSGAEETKVEWGKRLKEGLGGNAQVIIDVFPVLEDIIGPQEKAPELPPIETKNRFHESFVKFVEIFCSSERPVVLFLDDMQWADVSTIQILRPLLLSSSLKNFYLICAFRENHVSRGHPLTLELEEIEKHGGHFDLVQLKGLSNETILEILEDTLGCCSFEVEALASLIFEKTKGNPFFINEFLKSLYSDGLIKFDISSATWSWDIEEIRKRDFTQNVVDLMVSNLTKLPDDVCDLLKIGACLGSSFDLKALSGVCKESPSILAKRILPAIKKEFLKIQAEDNEFTEMARLRPEKLKFVFLHDRVQQGAYHLLDEEEAKEIHYKIAYSFENDENSNLQGGFEMIHHFNIAESLVTDELERLRISKLNYLAGMKAKSSASFSSAKDLFVMASKFLPIDHWKNHYRLSIDISIGLAECLFLCSEFDDAEKLCKSLLRRTESVKDSCRIHEVQINQFTIQGRYTDAIATASEALNKLGIYFPARPKLRHAMGVLLNVKRRVLVTPISKLREREDATDENALAALKILSNASTAAYIHGPEAMLFLCLRSVDITFKYGNSPVAAFAYALLAFIESAKLGGIELSKKFIELAKDINIRYDDPIYKCKVLLAEGCFIQHMYAPMEEALETLNESYQSGVNSGDYNFANYGLWAIIGKRYFLGHELSEIYQKACEYSFFSSQVQDKYTLPLLKIMRLHTSSLTGKVNEEFLEEDESFIESTFREEQLANGYYMGIAWFCVYDGIGQYLQGELSLAYSRFIESEKYVDRFLLGQVTGIEHQFFSCLVILRAYEKKEDCFEEKDLNIVKRNLRRLKYLAKKVPLNFKAKYLLAFAEYQRILKKNNGHLEIYEESIRCSKETGNFQVCAIANERLAEYYNAQQKRVFGEVYYKEAFLNYLNWGAETKAAQIKERFLSSTSSNSVSITSNQSIDETIVFDLDLSTVLKSSRALSGEIKLEKLLSVFMELITLNAGADKAYLMLEEEKTKTLSVQGAWRGEEGVKVLQDLPVDELDSIPLNIVKKVHSDHETIVCNDAASVLSACQKSYLKKYSPKSLLCMGILYQGRTIGVFYLENSLSEGTFTGKRIEVLSLLAAQAAISIVNASLYNNLEAKVQTRTQQLNEKNSELSVANEENKNLVRILCHDLNNTLSVLTMASGIGTKSKSIDEKMQAKLWKMVSSATQTQTEIVDHVKEMVAISSGKKRVQLEAVLIKEVLDKAIVIFETKLADKSIELVLPDESCETKVLANLVTLSNNVFNNILSNAIKFTPKGGRIEISIESSGEEVVLNISDNGVGMDDDLIENIFRYDKQTSREGTEGEKGTGFGMPLVKAYMDHFDGRVEVKSREIDRFPNDHGTTFSLFFRKPSKEEKMAA